MISSNGTLTPAQHRWVTMVPNSTQTPSNLLETGADTGIFQVVVGIPEEIVRDDKLERGEEITLTYVDHGDHPAQTMSETRTRKITTTIYTSNFGATIELDQRVYTWTDKVYVTVVAPDHNIDSDQVDEIGNDPRLPDQGIHPRKRH